MTSEDIAADGATAGAEPTLGEILPCPGADAAAGGPGPDAAAAWGPAGFESVLPSVFETVREKTGHDFSSYKLSTVLRRIKRRMSLHGVAELERYAALLRDNPQEAQALSDEILIGVTGFFRDPEAFEVVRRDIIPRLFHGRDPQETVRVWHPCCASGEEVYSMAMLIREYLDAAGLDVKVQFFATDLDESAIAHARAGLYGEEIGAEVGEERLAAFFTRAGEQWQVSKQLRESVIFAQHSLIKDPPFSRLDLLVCRNFLIYITPDMQRRLISLFHQVLKPGRFLFLGSAETIGHDSQLFAPLDKKWKIYQRLDGTPRGEFSFPVSSFRRPGPLRPPRSSESAGIPAASCAEKLLAERYAPPYVLVNDKYEVVHVAPRADRFLRVPAGEPTRDLLKMAVEELRPALRAAIYKAFAENGQVVFKGVKGGLGGDSVINVVVDPVPSAPGKVAMVVFEPASQPVEQKPAATGQGPDEEISGDVLVRQLEEQLRITHEQLQAATEQLETSHEGFLSVNEELMSINEEFQSANEELQSTNEELETSKEELQALNEELVTLNAELHAKVEELNLANNDLENLLTSSDIATLFLDPQLQIKRYTCAMAAIFNLIPADIGRPFRHFAPATEWSVLTHDAERVLATHTPMEREVAVKQGRHYLMRVLPYRTAEDTVDGVVVTLVDLTERKRMEDALLQAKEEWERTFDAVPDLIAIIDDQHRVVRANRAMAERLQAPPDGFLGAHCYRSVHCGDAPDPDCPHSRTLADGREHKVEVREERLGGDFLVSTTPLFDDSGRMTGSVHVARDITQRKRAEEELRLSKQLLEEQLAQLQAILDHLSDGVVISDLDGNLFHWNPAAVAMHGFASIEECVRKLAEFDELLELTSEDGGIIPLDRWPMSRVLAGETLHGLEVELRRRDTDWARVFSYGGTLACDRAGRPLLAVLSVTDVTESRRAQAALRANERRLGLALDAAQAAAWEVDLVTGRHAWDRRLFDLLRVPPQQAVEAEQRWSEFVVPEDRSRAEADFAEACAEGKLYRSEFRARRTDGEVRWYASQGRPLVEAGGRRKMVGVVQDVTERKAADELIRRHVEDLEATNRELTRFNKVSVGRELRMIELKKEINALCAGMAEPPRYPLEFEE